MSDLTAFLSQPKQNYFSEQFMIVSQNGPRQLPWEIESKLLKNTKFGEGR